jgi:predicted transcriptional regulator of viral defense system
MKYRVVGENDGNLERVERGLYIIVSTQSAWKKKKVVVDQTFTWQLEKWLIINN